MQISVQYGVALIQVHADEIRFREPVRRAFAPTVDAIRSGAQAVSSVIIDLNKVNFISRAACDELLCIEDALPCEVSYVNAQKGVSVMLQMVRNTHNPQPNEQTP